MTFFRLALRSHRFGAIALALMGGMAGILNGVGYIEIAGTTPEARHAFAQQMALLGKQLSYLLPAPVGLETVGGYLTWRDFSSIALVYTIWALLAGTGAARGDEERGQTEAWLAAGVSRVRFMATRGAGFALAALASVAITMAVTAVGAAIAAEPLDAGSTVLEGLDIYALTLVSFGLGVAIAQLVLTRRSAASLGIVAVVALYSLNSAVRTGVDVGPAAWISPFYLFDRSTPLVPGGPFDALAVVALFAIAVALVAFGTFAFARRDLGGALLRRVAAGQARPTMRPASDPLLRLPVLAIVDQQRVWTIGWAVGLSALGYFLVSLTRTMIDSLVSVPSVKAYFDRAGLQGYSDFIGVIWFSTALLILSALVVVQVNGWAADDAEGRLEAVLATGASRTRIVLERIAALLLVIAIAAGVSAIVVGIGAAAYDISVPWDRLVVATVLMLPVAFAFAGLGHLLVGWRPRVAVALLGAVAVYSYFVVEFAAIFDWPAWLVNTSAFSLYGSPMTKVDWTGVITLVAIGVFGTAAAVVAMRRRDVGT